MSKPHGLTRAELAAWLQVHYGAQSVTVRAWSPIADSCNEVTNAAGRHPDGAWYVAFDLAMPDEEEPEPLTVQLGEKDGQLIIYCTWEGYRLVEEQQNDPPRTI
jgi:hypothetical protein